MSDSTSSPPPPKRNTKKRSVPMATLANRAAALYDDNEIEKKESLVSVIERTKSLPMDESGFNSNNSNNSSNEAMDEVKSEESHPNTPTSEAASVSAEDDEDAYFESIDVDKVIEEERAAKKAKTEASFVSAKALLPYTIAADGTKHYMDGEAFNAMRYGMSSPYKVYYKVIKPYTHFKFERPATASAFEYSSIRTKNNLQQLPWKEYFVDPTPGEDGTAKVTKRNVFEGVMLTSMVGGVVSGPNCVIWSATLGLSGNLYIPDPRFPNYKPYANQPVQWCYKDPQMKWKSDLKYSICLCDLPFDGPGYSHGNKNPHAVEFFEDQVKWNEEVQREITCSDFLYKAARDTQIEAYLNSLAEERLRKATKEEKKSLVKKDIVEQLKRDNEAMQAARDLANNNLTRKFHPIVGPLDGKMKEPCEGRYYSHKIFRRPTKNEKPAVQKRLNNGEYDHLPTEYLNVMRTTNCDLIYDPLEVLTPLTAEERKQKKIDTNWKEGEPEPMYRPMSWEERSAIGYRFIGTVLYEDQLAKNDSKGVGLRAEGNALAVIVQRFGENSKNKPKSRAEMEKEYNEPAQPPEF